MQADTCLGADWSLKPNTTPDFDATIVQEEWDEDDGDLNIKM